jgi:hypothetical protein
MTHIEAMKLALKALDGPYDPEDHECVNVALAALDQAIAEAELVQRAEDAFSRSEQKPVYETPQRKPLTLERIIQITDEIPMDNGGVFVLVARAVEAAHGIKEKNT